MLAGWRLPAQFEVPACSEAHASSPLPQIATDEKASHSPASRNRSSTSRGSPGSRIVAFPEDVNGADTCSRLACPPLKGGGRSRRALDENGVARREQSNSSLEGVGLRTKPYMAMALPRTSMDGSASGHEEAVHDVERSYPPGHRVDREAFRADERDPRHLRHQRKIDVVTANLKPNDGATAALAWKVDAKDARRSARRPTRQA